jgi:RHH-type proline utilization regulon transcriptional repressor/proline dehydrogenase/delta 1-pyrroline-5-carboxylate dehydrogenase
MAELSRDSIRSMHYALESEALQSLGAIITSFDTNRTSISTQASQLVEFSRARASESGTLDAFLREFGLSNAEGIALMCLAEALLRVPDEPTLDALISEKIREGNWGAHQNASDSNLVNASIWGLMLAGKIVGPGDLLQQVPANWLAKLTHRIGEPTVRLATLQAMKILGGQFILGRDIDSALKRAGRNGTLCSFDMLGEGARTQKDADRYFHNYLAAIETVGDTSTASHLFDGHNVSVKLSALHPRFWESHRETCLPALREKVLALAVTARRSNIGMSLDAEECARLELTMDVFEWLCEQTELEDWQGLGFVLQAYQKRALKVAEWLIALAQSRPAGIMVRLVKGAYWDAEIKIAQQRGLTDYPVFTRKSHTDVSYEACMRTLIACPKIYCQFATHNALTIAQIREAAGECDRPFEFQKLHGMGDLLYALLEEQDPSLRIRTYAPVGQHEDLLPYLVRRLLENGANSSFVNRFLDADLPVSELVLDPLNTLPSNATSSFSHIPLPRNIFQGSDIPWLSSAGFDLDERSTGIKFETANFQMTELSSDRSQQPECETDMTENSTGDLRSSTSPADSSVVGQYSEATQADVIAAIERARNSLTDWSSRCVTERAAILERAAELFEARTAEFTSLIAKEAGRTLNDGVDEVREAVDFCRYYAAQAMSLMHSELELPGVTGETNRLSYAHRGPWLCISPWNFPLAIFTGQIVANLAVGNTVIAKPAEQTPLVAQLACDVLKEAGVPEGVLNLVNGDGPTLGSWLLPDERIAGVSFTGSHPSARVINRQLASRDGPIIPFIAETGGINCMIVDSTALPEQVVDDVITSAFRSAGQRCSALRVLFLQSDVADGVIELLAGAMRELKVGDPHKLSTDVGPVIDQAAHDRISAHLMHLQETATFIAKSPSADPELNGYFVEPQAWEISSLLALQEEVFGPVLHIVRYHSEDLDTIIKDIRSSKFALTMGIHSRLKGVHERLAREHLVGNLYVNRDTVGAVVGSNPFGGHGLSGTGPKAGGPNYLRQLVVEHTVTDNVTALGGNTELFNLE